MITIEEVNRFLDEFKVKTKVFAITGLCNTRSERRNKL